MSKAKQIKALEERLSAVEEELNTLKSALFTQGTPNKGSNSYEEVINEWLCGKENK